MANDLVTRLRDEAEKTGDPLWTEAADGIAMLMQSILTLSARRDEWELRAGAAENERDQLRMRLTELYERAHPDEVKE